MEQQKQMGTIASRMLISNEIDISSEVADKNRVVTLLSILDEVNLMASEDLYNKTGFFLFQKNDVLDSMYEELHNRLEDNTKKTIDQLRSKVINSLINFYNQKSTEGFFESKLLLEGLSLTLRAEAAKQLNDIEKKEVK